MSLLMSSELLAQCAHLPLELRLVIPAKDHRSLPSRTREPLSRLIHAAG
jgi:hypothetical protein